MIGKIIKGIAGFYYIASEGSVYTCKAKGLFRKLSLKPLVGDIVSFTPAEAESEGSITDIHKRKNELIRPAVANIDMIIIILAIAKPEPALYLLDKYLVQLSKTDIPVAIAFNKTDLGYEDKLKEYTDIYTRAGYKVLELSSYNNNGIDKLKELIKGKSVVLAGPSGVGKSSITNVICPGLDVKTDTISQKIDRGRHTTRHSEFFVAGDQTYICDTPGFTAIDVEDCSEDELKEYFPEFKPYLGKCRFNSCIHISEPDCAIKNAVEKGKIALSRYNSYKKLYEEILRRRRF